MEIIFNNQKKTVKKSSTLLEVLCLFNLSKTKGIAVAINKNIIPKEEWKKNKLNENDSIIVITATAGG